jgi:hypothetical protein
MLILVARLSALSVILIRVLKAFERFTSCSRSVACVIAILKAVTYSKQGSRQTSLWCGRKSLCSVYLMRWYRASMTLVPAHARLLEFAMPASTMRLWGVTGGKALGHVGMVVSHRRLEHEL